jgi:hypothetical protein
MPTLPESGKMIFITRPARKRENLQVLLKSAAGLPEIPCVENFDLAEALIPPDGSMLAIIDHHIPLDEIREGLQKIRRKNPHVGCIIMLAHPFQKKEFSSIQLDDWIYEDFTFDDIRRLLELPVFDSPGASLV